MGNTKDPNEGQDDELPVHTVQISAFTMARHEVIQAEWDEVRTWGLANGYTDLATGISKATNHPIHSITWYNAVKWCNARSEKAGLSPCYFVTNAVYRIGARDDVTCDFSAGGGYRLPTEAEWEKAARGWSATTRFAGSDTIAHTLANYYASSYVKYDLSFTLGFHKSYTNGPPPYTAPVGSFAPNGYGIYDMAGNVFEWCWD